MKNMFVTAVLIIQALSFLSVQAQSYQDILARQKVIINYDDHTVVTYTKPVKKLLPKNDRYYYWLSGNSINVTQAGFSGKPLNGSFVSFYLNKNLKESGQFVNGLKVGEWKNWNDQGVLTDKYVWKGGKKNGLYQKYNSDGKRIEYGSFRNDLLEGKRTVIVDSLQVSYYKQGKLVHRRQLIPKFINKLFHPVKATSK
jgi:antitoxin component YwqK of YwqJK toxin-antitoxin module